jgi:hypothetical protein
MGKLEVTNHVTAALADSGASRGRQRILVKPHLLDSESSWPTMDGTEEPDESITHVRVCGGAGWVTTGSTRKPTPWNAVAFPSPRARRG